MKNVLIQADRRKVKHKMKSEIPKGRLAFWSVKGKPRETGAGARIMFSDGERVFAESVILDVSKGKIEFDPLNPVNKPNPVEPPDRGFKYVLDSERGVYTIDFVGVEHEFDTVKDLVTAILKHRPKCRNSDTELKFTIWKEVQDLDLNKKDEFRKRINDRTITRVRAELQNHENKFLPTDEEVLKERFNRADEIRGYYANSFDSSTVKRLDEYFGVKNERIGEVQA